MNKIEQIEADIYSFKMATAQMKTGHWASVHRRAIRSLELSLEIAKGGKFVGEWERLEENECVDLHEGTLVYNNGSEQVHFGYSASANDYFMKFNGSAEIPTPKEKN